MHTFIVALAGVTLVTISVIAAKGDAPIFWAAMAGIACLITAGGMY